MLADEAERRSGRVVARVFDRPRAAPVKRGEKVRGWDSVNFDLRARPARSRDARTASGTASRRSSQGSRRSDLGEREHI